jgi:GntR family transcriptional regulator/MocR family aminotransferase
MSSTPDYFSLFSDLHPSPPLAWTLPLEPRLVRLNWARETGADIVEDDYDSDFRYDGPLLTALAGHDGEDVVLYMGTFSKSIGAGLRLGYLVVPGGAGGLHPFGCFRA